MATYSKEEIEKLDKNFELIMGFLTEKKKEVRSSIEIKFGDYRYGSYQYTLCFGPHSAYVRTGYTSVSLEKDDKTCTGYIGIRSDRSDILAKMCRDWKSIKEQVLEHVDSQKALTDAINNFEV